MSSGIYLKSKIGKNFLKFKVAELLSHWYYTSCAIFIINCKGKLHGQVKHNWGWGDDSGGLIKFTNEKLEECLILLDAENIQNHAGMI